MSRRHEIDCLIKLDDKIDCLRNIIEFLSEEKVIDLTKTAQLINEFKLELPYEVHKALRKSLNDESVQLVDYKWELLPSEKICVTIITKQSRRDFSWETH